MRMFSERIARETPELRRRGRADALHRPPRARRAARCSSRWTGPRRETAANDRITLFVAFNYGGRAEILDAARALQRRRRGGVPARCSTRPRCTTPTSSSAPAASSGCPTTCCGSRPTPSSSSATSCGPTSRARRSRRRWTSTSAAGAGSGAADGGPSRRRAPARAEPAARRARAPAQRAARTSARASPPRSRRSPSRSLIVGLGGWVFVGRAAVLGVHLPARAVRDVRRAQPVAAGGLLGLLGAARRRPLGDQASVLRRLRGLRAAGLPARACCSRATAARPAVAVTMLGLRWVGLALAHAVLLRDLPHGDGIVVDVLVGTFIGDTGAYLGGRAFGRGRWRRRSRPTRRVEGLAHRHRHRRRGGVVRRALPGLAERLARAAAGRGGGRRRRRSATSSSPTSSATRDEGHRAPVRRPRRRAGPPRRRAVHRRRRLLRLARDVCSSGWTSYTLSDNMRAWPAAVERPPPAVLKLC